MISRLYAVVAQLDRASAFEAEASITKRRLFALCHEQCHDDAEAQRQTRALRALRRKLIWRQRLRGILR